MTKSTDIDPAEFQESLQDLSLKESLQAGLPHPGLPGPLPENEHVIWQGAPYWRNFARNVFYSRIVVAYFGIVMLVLMGISILDGGDWREAAKAAIPVIFFALITIGILSILAWIGARATIYTVTNRRVVMRIGAAFSKSVDIPFKVIESVQLKSSPAGLGNISIKLKVGNSIPYFFIWPHARPWRFREAEPMLRAVDDVEAIAKILVEQLEAGKNQNLDELRQGPEENPDLPANKSTMPGNKVAKSTSSVRRFFGEREGIIVKGAVFLAIASFVAIFVVQRLDPSNKKFVAEVPKKIHQIKVKHIGSGRLSLVDVEKQKVIVVVESEGEGLIRNAIRGLERNRRQEKKPIDSSYQLIAWEGNRITLSDMELDRHIPLTSFGPLDTGALAILKKLVLPAQSTD
ncbi:MAG: photosynthetic complex putative assembly protein PuhB [Pseudomonadota bacterium]|nr:photosynthetic complex putative assembly protein PuhB [Pseudomonadota bacterium]